MNRNKTEAMWLGSNKYCTDEYYDIKWKLRVKIIGIYFSNSIPASEIYDNWLQRIENIQRTIVTWSKKKKKKSSIMGQIWIVKSLLLPQIIFAMQALVAPADVIKNINTLLLLFFRFIWKKNYSNTKAFENVKRQLCVKKWKKEVMHD